MKESIVDERRVRAGKAQRSEGPRGARRGAERLYLVGGERGQGPPDVRITEEDKQLVRRLVAELEAVLSPEVLFHLCCGIEEAVQRRRASA